MTRQVPDQATVEANPPSFWEIARSLSGVVVLLAVSILIMTRPSGNSFSADSPARALHAAAACSAMQRDINSS